MRAGNLRHLITFQVRTETRDAIGGITESWADSITAWAAIWPLRSDERIDAMQLEHSISHKIRVRHQSGITAKHRIKYQDPDGDRYFNVRSIINPDERNIMLEILADEEPLT